MRIKNLPIKVDTQCQTEAYEEDEEQGKVSIREIGFPANAPDSYHDELQQVVRGGKDLSDLSLTVIDEARCEESFGTIQRESLNSALYSSNDENPVYKCHVIEYTQKEFLTKAKRQLQPYWNLEQKVINQVDRERVKREARAKKRQRLDQQITDLVNELSERSET